jgi:uncharacterized membrane protein
MISTVGLALATLAFVGTHFVMSHPLRDALVARLGERGFLGLYSLISFVTLGWMILAWRGALDPGPLWVAPLWWWSVASAIMLVASILLVGSLMKNPALPRPGAVVKHIPPPQGVFAITRHPMNWSFMIWAAVHVSLWGSPRNLIVAGGIFLLALLGSIGQDAKKARLIGQPWRDWQARTSFIPFGVLLQGKVKWNAVLSGWIALVGGLVLWALVTSYHAPLVAPLGGLLSR